MPVLTFVGRVEFPHIKRKCGGVLGEIEAGVLRCQHELPEGRLFGKEVAESHALVEGPEDQVKSATRRLALPQMNRDLVVMVRHPPLHIEGVFPSFVVRLSIRACNFKISIHGPRSHKIQSEGRVFENRDSLVRNPIIRSHAGQIGLRIGFQLKFSLEAAVRRGHGEHPRAKTRAGRSHKHTCQQKCDEQNRYSRPHQ